MKVKTILVSQPEPSSEKSPYKRLQEKLKLTVDFRPFIHVEGATAKEVRQQKIVFGEFDNVVLTSRNAVDHYFRLCKEMRFTVPDSTKYFCLSEAVAFYLQKYVVYRKRKVYVGEGKINDLEAVFKKFNKETFLFPTSDQLKKDVPDFLDHLGLKWQRAILYRTVVSDLSDLRDVYYDVLAFFSPSGIESLFKNFPDFKQNKTRIAAYGNTTIKAAEEAGLEVQIKAPSPDSPSMTMAIEQYVDKVNKV
ncbi:MAG: uroporphyrinogen-III synthase [Flavobacteriaceae bacterium]